MLDGNCHLRCTLSFRCPLRTSVSSVVNVCIDPPRQRSASPAPLTSRRATAAQRFDAYNALRLSWKRASARTESGCDRCKVPSWRKRHGCFDAAFPSNHPGRMGCS